jgi:hypothetical protein
MLIILLLLWVALLVALIAFAIGSRREGGALTLAYFIGLSLIHVPGVLVFFGRGGLPPNDQETLRGFEMTLVGISAFVAGAIVVARKYGVTSSESAIPRSRIEAFERIGWRLMGVGMLAYFVLVPMSFAVPSLTSPVAALGTLLVIGIWLRFYGSLIANDRLRMWMTLALVPLLPFATIVSGGFISYGTYWALSAIGLLFVIVPDRKWFYFTAVPIVYLGLSLFVTYMGERLAIRQVVQQEQAGISERLTRIAPIITGFQLLDLDDAAHSTALNDRLNQNWLVGAGIIRHEDGLTELAYGGTVPWWAPIPRALWRDKPVVGGGGDIVADYTGIDFGSDTSVGVGQVLEFYINFGVPGVIIGFAGLGALLMWLDRGIMVALSRGDLHGILVRAMPGLSLLQPGGNLIEIVVGTVTALLVAYMLLYFRIFRVPLSAGASIRRA